MRVDPLRLSTKATVAMQDCLPVASHPYHDVVRAVLNAVPDACLQEDVMLRAAGVLCAESDAFTSARTFSGNGRAAIRHAGRRRN